MIRSSKIAYFDTEGRENLSAVVKCIKAFLKAWDVQDESGLRKLVFLTTQGEGPMLAYNQLQQHNLQIIAVTFPNGAAEMDRDGDVQQPEIAARVRDFFTGVRIPIVTSRLPFDDILGAEAHNREMKLLRDALGLFGSSMALAVQAVLQATDAGHIAIGEQVIAATGDTALLVTATTTRNLLRRDAFGLSINEIICKPRMFTISRRAPEALKQLPIARGIQIEGEALDSPDGA